MTLNKRKKNTRQKGSKTHGWGSMKKHRGAGHRGGRGRAGSGKGGDCKNPTFARMKKYFGRHGFTTKTRNIVVPINAGYFDLHLEEMIASKKIVEEAGVYKIDCTALGFNKLLSVGAVKSKFEIKVEQATPKAIEKVEAAGGKVVLANA